MNESRDVVRSSGNVFADLGFDDPDAELAKAELAHRIATAIDNQRWSQARAAKELGVDQAKVSAIVRGRLGGFSMERLMRLLTRLNFDVQITVSPNPSMDRPARIGVMPPSSGQSIGIPNGHEEPVAGSTRDAARGSAA